MKRSCLLPFALVSSVLLSACGSRSSLTDPGAAECGPWSVRDGVAGTERHARAYFTALDDGSVVLPMQDIVRGAGDVGWAVYSVRKIDPNGEPAWNTIGDAWTVSAVARDAAGTLVVLGFVDPEAKSVLGAKLTCPEKTSCVFLGKLAETGTLAWSKVISSNVAVDGRVVPKDLAMTSDGRMTIEGHFGGTVDFGCGPLIAVPGAGYPSRYLAQLSPSGECLWSRAILGTPRIEAAFDDLAVNDEGEVALTLPLQGKLGAQALDLGGGPVPFDTEKGSGFAVARYAPNGDLVFAKVVGGGMAAAPAVPTAGSRVSVVVTGAGEVLFSTKYAGTLDLGGGPKGSPSAERHFVTKLGAKGEELWTRDIAAGAVNDLGYPFSLAAEPGGDFFLAGLGEPGMKVLGKPTPETALFVAAYDAGGEPIGVQTFPLAGTAFVSGLEASADGALVLAGGFTGTLDFGQDPLVSEGLGDAFVARICR